MPSIDRLSRRQLLALCGGCTAGGSVGGYAYGADVFADDCDPAPVTASPTDWPFPGYDAGFTHAAPAASAPDPDADLAERWHVRPSGGRLGQPVVANGDAIVPSASSSPRWSGVHVYDLRSGERRWRADDVSTTEPFAVTAIDNSVYTYGTTDDGHVPVALAAGDGRRRWAAENGFDASTPSFSTPVVCQGLVHFGTKSTAYAFDARTGERCWKQRLGEWFRRTPGCGDRTVIYAGQMDRELVALAPRTGAEQWRIDVTPYLHPNHDAPDSKINDTITETPIVGGGRVFVPTFGGRLVAFDEPSGDHEWTATSSRTELVDRGEYTYGPASFDLGALTDDVLLVVESDPLDDAEALRAFDPEGGEELWSVAPGADEHLSFTRPTMAGETAYVVEFDRSRGYARLLRFDARTGERIDAFDLEGHTASSPAIANEAVLVTTSDGVFALEAA